MNQDTYKVVLSGKLLNNQTMDVVKKRMAALFKTTAPVIEKLFARPNAVIKKNLPMEKANRYVKAIEKAGAACYLEKMASSPAGAPASQKTRPAPVAPAPQQTPVGTGLRVIPVQTAYKGEERFTPKPVDTLTASAGGLNFNTDDLLDVNYDQIAALAAYSPTETGNEGDGDPIRFLLFLKSTERPFVMDSRHIDYQAFQENPPSKPAGAFRGFLHFLCRQNTAMILEETTFDFLSGNELPKFDNEKAMKYATAIGMLIEEGGEGEEG
ncbi:MAG: hypothetical protein R6T92_07450 [Desulfosalsimonadaceae bacterium]